VTALARPRSNCTYKLQTRALVREGVQNQEAQNCQTEKKNLVISSRWGPETQTQWATDRPSQLGINFGLVIGGGGSSDAVG
jgi:hypothetical protein